MRRKDEEYSNYWNENGINLSSEFLSYRYLCEDFEKREQKKYKDVEKFCTYSKWEKHILGQKKDLKANGTLDEFIRYLKLKKRNCETANSVYLQYQMSLSAAFFIMIMTDGVLNIEIAGNLQGIIRIIFAISLVIFIQILTRTCVLNETAETELRKYFYEDYLEIMQSSRNEE